MIIQISDHIEHLQQIGKDRNLSVIIFTFMYQEVPYKCFYRQNGEEITVAPEGYSVAFNIPIKNYKLNNFIPEDAYLKLKEIHKDLETKVFCNNMLDAIMNLTQDMVLKISLDIYKPCATRFINYNEDERIYFYCWSRSFSGRKPTKKNLEKTRALFKSEEIYLFCKLNNISSRWKNKPTKNSALIQQKRD